jgi:hypothetical protein
METFNKAEIQNANKALFLEKVQSFVDKGIISMPEKKSCVSGNVRFTFKYKIDNKLNLIKITQHLYNKGFIACFHNWDSCYLSVTIPEKNEEDVNDKTKYHKITVSYPDNTVKQVSSTSFDKALEASNVFLEAIEDLFSN